MVTQYPLQSDAFIWALSAFCQLNRIPFSPELVVKQYPPPYTNIQLEQALQSFGFNTTLKQTQLSKLNAASLPCLAILKPSTQASSSQLEPTINLDQDQAEAVVPPLPTTQPVALILSIDKDRVLLLEPNQAQPLTLSIAEAESRLTGDFLMVRKAAETVADDEDALDADKAGTGNANQPATNLLCILKLT